MPDSRARFITRLLALPAKIASGLIGLYQHSVSPALTALNPAMGCRFSPTCSHYARDAFQTHGLFFGLFLAARRLVKCGPWHPGGEDLVPAVKFSCVRTARISARSCGAPLVPHR
ncbi:MAG: membrane protein insertion efficiency factor YidD [Opitutaceae bacterium]|nr:membrane protein insertion efficiency factor YidD [Opitutaceae bacterium]